MPTAHCRVPITGAACRSVRYSVRAMTGPPSARIGESAESDREKRRADQLIGP